MPSNKLISFFSLVHFSHMEAQHFNKLIRVMEILQSLHVMRLLSKSAASFNHEIVTRVTIRERYNSVFAHSSLNK